MEDKVIEGVSQSTGFSPLEIVLMSVVAILFTVFMRYVIKTTKEIITAMSDNRNAIENNTKAMEKFPDVVHDKIMIALKK